MKEERAGMLNERNILMSISDRFDMDEMVVSLVIREMGMEMVKRGLINELGIEILKRDGVIK